MKNYFSTTLFVISLTLSLTQPLKAQQYEYIPFPDSGAVWSEVYYPGFGNGEPVYERFALNGEDTVIENKIYSKLFLFHDSVFNINTATYFGGIREDSNKRVYFKGNVLLHSMKPMNGKHDFKEIVLYDFSGNIGDTIHKMYSEVLFNCYDYHELIIKNIDTVLIGDTYRKRYYFESYFWVQWIEGIGNTYGLLFSSGDIPNNGMGGGIICFQQNNQTLYSTSNDCYPEIVNVSEKSNIHFSLKIYPQPAKHDLNIEFSKPDSGVLTIYNCTGAVVGQQTVNAGTFTYQVNSKDLKPGIYLVNLHSQDNIIKTTKMVITE